EEAEILEYSFLFVLIPLFSPLAWYYNYLYSHSGYRFSDKLH
ncbi:unnamed protein product, partial [marine sediment metagenome]